MIESRLAAKRAAEPTPGLCSNRRPEVIQIGTCAYVMRSRLVVRKSSADEMRVCRYLSGETSHTRTCGQWGERPESSPRRMITSFIIHYPERGVTASKIVNNRYKHTLFVPRSHLLLWNSIIRATGCVSGLICRHDRPHPRPDRDVSPNRNIRGESHILPLQDRRAYGAHSSCLLWAVSYGRVFLRLSFDFSRRDHPAFRKVRL